MYELAVLAMYIVAIAFLSVISIGLTSDLLSDKGSNGIAMSETITLALGTAVGVPVTAFLITDAAFWEFPFVGFLSALAIVYFTSRQRNRMAQEAPALVEFVQREFDRIDTGRTGRITRYDINHAIDSGSFSAADVKMLKLLLWRVEAIGHAYDWMMVDTLPPSFPVGMYAINRGDLADYVERTHRFRGGLLV